VSTNVGSTHSTHSSRRSAGGPAVSRRQQVSHALDQPVYAIHTQPPVSHLAFPLTICKASTVFQYCLCPLVLNHHHFEVYSASYRHQVRTVVLHKKFVKKKMECG